MKFHAGPSILSLLALIAFFGGMTFVFTLDDFALLREADVISTILLSLGFVAFTWMAIVHVGYLVRRLCGHFIIVLSQDGIARAGRPHVPWANLRAIILTDGHFLRRRNTWIFLSVRDRHAISPWGIIGLGSLWQNVFTSGIRVAALPKDLQNFLLWCDDCAKSAGHRYIFEMNTPIGKERSLVARGAVKPGDTVMIDASGEQVTARIIHVIPWVAILFAAEDGRRYAQIEFNISAVNWPRMIRLQDELDLSKSALQDLAGRISNTPKRRDLADIPEAQGFLPKTLWTLDD